MVIRVIKKNLSILMARVGLCRANYKQFIEHYLCMLKSLSCSKVDFLYAHSHKIIRTNYYTINYPKLWEIIPESKDFFTPLQSGEIA